MNPRALLVDDEPSLLFTFRAIMERAGFEVETSSSAEQAIQKLQGGVFHLVISDLRMETDLAGREVIRVAKAQGYDPIAVLLTAYPPTEAEWKNWGADALFEKPLGANALLEELKVLMQERSKPAISKAVLASERCE